MANTQPASFSELLSSAWSLVKQRMNMLLPGMILFTVLTVLLQIPLAGMEEEGVQLAPGQIGVAIVASVASALAGIIGYLYFLLVVTGNDQSVMAVLKKTLPRVFPFVGLSILVFIYSFAWLSFVGALMGIYAGMTYATNPMSPSIMVLAVLLIAAGFVCGLIFGIRYLLAPIVWETERLKVTDAIKRSYDLSKGYWGKIFGNVLLLVLITIVIMIGVGIVGGILGSIGGSAGGAVTELLITGLITTFFAHFYNVVLLAFLFKLAATIKANPRSAVASPAAPAAPAAPKPVKAAAPAPAASKTAAKKKVPAKKPVAKKTASKKKE